MSRGNTQDGSGYRFHSQEKQPHQQVRTEEIKAFPKKEGKHSFTTDSLLLIEIMLAYNIGFRCAV